MLTKHKELHQVDALYMPLNWVVEHMVRTLMPQGFQTTEDESEINTYKKLVRHFNETGMIKVWTGASDKTVFGSPEVNHAFRAWHDFVHVTKGLPFTGLGERATCEWQKAQVMGVPGLTYDEQIKCQHLIHCEVVGQLEHYERTKTFINDQRSFALQWLRENGVKL